MTASITLTSLGFPTTIDVSNGPVSVPFTVAATLAPGVTIADVTLNLNLGNQHVSLVSDGKLTDTFDDATPGAATSVFQFSGATRPGDYVVDSVSIRDTAGNVTTVQGWELDGLHAPSAYTVVNTHAPAAPTIQLASADGDVFNHSRAGFSGTAAPGSVVAVTALDDDFQDYTWFDLGTATTDASGHWTLTTPALLNGNYALARATATLDGNQSAYSAPLAFHVAASAPDAPTLLSHLDSLGNASSATPFVSGYTVPNGPVTIYDGDTVVASVVAGREGWFGALTTPLAAGTHKLTAVATDLAGHASAPSQPLALTVGRQPQAGFKFDIATMTNDTGTAIDQAQVQHLLDEVGTILSSMIDGNEQIAMTVQIQDHPAGNANAAAAASPGPMTIDAATGMPQIPHGYLYLSTAYVNQVLTEPQLGQNTVSVLTHELLHVLAFHSTIDPATQAPQLAIDPFGHLTHYTDGTPYFTGFYASALNGGPVQLADTAHLANANDIMYPGTVGAPVFFSAANPDAPLSGLDLAILKDVGYTIKDAFASSDGHTFVAGDGTPGHDKVTGTAGLDTLLVNGKASAFAVHGNAAAATLADSAHGVTQHLSGIERIHFADGTLVLDTGAGQDGGAAYRLYQAAFGRAPDAAGLGFWVGALDHGASLASAADAFVGSAEFAQLYGTALSDKQFVDQLYQNVLHRAPDAAGEAYWVDALHGGTTHAAVLVGLSESAENVAAVGASIANGFTVA